jgi:XRE family aerobic/anaerobic benzoate catabolism transcriptional regulator
MRKSRAPRSQKVGRRVPRKTDDPLKVLGEQVRRIRARRGMSRKSLSKDSGVSERYLAQIEGGKGNISILVLRQLAHALDVPLDNLFMEGPDPPVEFVHTVEFLRRLSLDDLKTARYLLLEHFGGIDAAARHRRIALIGLRGAGKSTLGALLAERLEMPFIELDRLIETASGLSLNVIFDLYGQTGFRRFEEQYLNQVLDEQPRFVLASAGGIVSEPASFERLLTSCFTVWIRTSPEEHMRRIVDQGDMRLLDENQNALDDLKRTLDEREALYSNADVQIDTTGRTVEESLEELLRILREAPVRNAAPVSSVPADEPPVNK